jgi:small-conductance mechanosensitive channel
MNYFQRLIEQINLFIQSLSLMASDFITISPKKAFFVFGSFIAIMFLISQTKNKFLQNKNASSTQVITRLLSPIIVYIVVYYFYTQNQGNLILMSLNSLAMFWLLASLIYLPYLYIEDVSKLKITIVLPLVILGIILNDVSLLIEHILITNSVNLKDLLVFSKVITKIIVVFATYLYMRAFLIPIYERLLEHFKFLERLKPLIRYSSTALLIVGTLWMFNVVQFGTQFFLGIALLLVFIALLYYLDFFIPKMVKHNFPSPLFDYREQQLLIKKTKFIFLLLLPYFYYHLGYKMMNFAKVEEFLTSLTIINTRFITISVYKTIVAVWLFMLLKSILHILINLIRKMSSKKDAITTGSLETLTYNLGTLLIIAITSVEIGITWQVVIPIASAIGIGVGVGIQGILNNYVSGFILLFSKKVKIGDIVELEGNAGRLIGLDTDTVFGKVRSIDIFATTIKTFDNVDVAVPNSVLISDNIVNYTQEDEIVRVRVPIGVSYLSDVSKVKDVIMEAIEESPYVIKHMNNDVWFNEFGDSSLNFFAICWVDIKQAKHPRNVRVDIIERVWFKFKEHDIEIPYPQNDIWFRNSLKIERNNKNNNEQED